MNLERRESLYDFPPATLENDFSWQEAWPRILVPDFRSMLRLSLMSKQLHVGQYTVQAEQDKQLEASASQIESL